MTTRADGITFEEQPTKRKRANKGKQPVVESDDVMEKVVENPTLRESVDKDEDLHDMMCIQQWIMNLLQVMTIKE